MAWFSDLFCLINEIFEKKSSLRPEMQTYLVTVCFNLTFRGKNKFLHTENFKWLSSFDKIGQIPLMYRRKELKD